MGVGGREAAAGKSGARQEDMQTSGCAWGTAGGPSMRHADTGVSAGCGSQSVTTLQARYRWASRKRIEGALPNPRLPPQPHTRNPKPTPPPPLALM